MSELQRVKQTLAEAQQQLQAWERQGQIEAALERVRARSMAMHQSDELAEVIAVIFEQLHGLGFAVDACYIYIIQEESRDYQVWLSTTHQPKIADSINVPSSYWDFEHPLVARNHEAIEQGETFYTEVYSRQEKDRLYQWAFEHSGLKHLPEERKAYIMDRPGLARSVALMKHGHLVISNFDGEPFSEEENAVLRRFAHVFEQTYTHFLDLEQAEERACEAVRQASADRVRAEIASMRTTDDLERITPLIWRELTTLGVPFFRCGVFIIDEATEHVDVFLSTPQGAHLASLHLAFDSMPLIRKAVASWRARQIHTEVWDQQQFAAWTQSLMELGQIENLQGYQGGDVPPDSLALQFVPFVQGMFYVGSSAPLSDDEIGLVQTLAEAFVIAYARYEDFKRLEVKNQEVEQALAHLRQTQARLLQAEKMASLGQLTAGIAHEIQNPLNFVNNFAEVNDELARELIEELAANDDKPLAEVRELLDDLAHGLKTNARQIAKHGKRADRIVKNMMEHARGGLGERYDVGLNKLVDEYVNLAHHGMRARTTGFTVEIERHYGEAVGAVEMMPQEIGRVVLNVLGNAFEAVHERAQSADGSYVPGVKVMTRRVDGQVEIRVCDNGSGIPVEVKDRIFEPFFTTKPAGSGTGLGLSLSYDIVTQGHGGTLTVETEEGEGATFVITLPHEAKPTDGVNPSP